MPPTPSTFVPAEAPVEEVGALTPATARRLDELRQAFALDFALLDPAPPRLARRPADQPAWNWLERAEMCAQVASRGRPEFLLDEDPLLLLALPIPSEDEAGGTLVALGLFLPRAPQAPEELAPAATALGVELDALWRWSRERPVWNARAVEQMARLLLDNWSSRARQTRLEQEVEQITSNLVATYEEISLLHRLTRNLKISRGEKQLGRLALEWLADALPTESLAIAFHPHDSGDSTEAGEEARGELSVLTHGACPLDDDDFARLLDYLGRDRLNEPLVLNHLQRIEPDWPFESVRSLIAAPLAEGEKTFGWLFALNHSEGEELGTVEASLLASVGAILGIHGGNLDLYRQQAEFLGGVVRALTSAIDAKDPYTCGHSDRVARISTRLAQEMGCDDATISTVYLSGLLHDIGKIGIDDNVLRKAGKLTDAEYEHIKLHPELGYKILRDLKQLDPVLPAVLHHHEAWDGTGYPHRLAGEEIPLLARIVAVADSFDAMSSDRPYRQGMPAEKLERILASGAATQWDPRVIAAFLAARDDIYQIAHREREAIQLDVQQWH